MPEPLQPRSTESSSSENASVSAPEGSEPVEQDAEPAPDVAPGAAVPASEPAPADTAIVVIEQPAAPRRRRRWIGWLIAGVILVVLLVVAAIVGDALARQAATAAIRERIIAVLDLPADAVVDVDLGTGSLLLQAARGRVDIVTIDIPQLTVGGITGAAVLTAKDVPLSETDPVRELDVRVTVPEKQVQKLSGYLSGIELTSIALTRGVIEVGTDLTVLFITIPVTVDLVPSATPSGIAFTPETITAQGQTMSVDELLANPLISGLAGDLLASQEFCLADSVPEALVVRDVVVEGSDLVLTLGATNTALSDPSFTRTGTCP
jgi:hypothetical protein